GETSSELSANYGEGNYQVTIFDGNSCRVSESFEHIIPIFDIAEQVVICEGDYYQFGNVQLTEEGFYLDTFPSQNNCDSIVALELSVIGFEYDTVEVIIPNGSSYKIGNQSFESEGNYPLIFTSSVGCDSLVLLKLLNFDIYIPNVFSPNLDGINEIFQAFGPQGEIQSVDMKIFDRWGNLVFEGSEWNGADLPPNVYAYAIDIEFKHGISQQYYGSVTLVR
ncbi:MAG: T9SS type B sorting domain-containing protein, partial [Saprospiraceae bacterium]|nr:T9SS type B sorting domain-containing protein [Saprospiraceae bacterium]